ncbi:MAG: Family ership [Pseudomonadota bacterium]|jgi:purine-nucleoside phosphorylase
MTRASDSSDRDTRPIDPVDCAAAYIQQSKAEPPQVGVVLGSGLGAWASQLEQAEPVPYTGIPHMPAPSVAGHTGRLWLGRRGPARVACLEGRVHAYEGHAVERVVFGVRLLATLGCRAVLLTNAAGGIRSDLAPGTLMLITDHLNLTGRNPLVGWNPAGGHPPFIDLTRAYDPALAEEARSASQNLGQELAEGVYAGLLGPSYETPAEIRMLRTLGADAVGMSTVLETIALRERGVRVGAVSCITNVAAGLSAGTLSHAEVQETAAQARGRFAALLDAWVVRAAALG